MADIDRNLRAPSGLQLPDVGDGDADAAEHGGTGLPDPEMRREYGIGAGNGDRAGLRRPAPAESLANAHHFFECRCHARPSMMKPPSCRDGRPRSTRRDRLLTRTLLLRPICSSSITWGRTMQWQIGDVTVTKIVELETTGGSRFILPQATREAILPISWLMPHFADEEGRLKMSIHALMVEAPGRRIIVDTCLGNDKK